MALIYKTVVTAVADIINKSQYFNPFLSWLVVSFIYFSIGIRSDTIWRYLYEVTNWGFFANLFSIIKFVSKNVGYKYDCFFRYFVWPESICFGFNEWGLVYINFIKIRSCIKTLKSKTWSFLIYAFLVYTMICRCAITYYEIKEEKLKDSGEKDIKIISVKLHAILYVPMGIFELIFLYFIIKNIMNEEDQKSRSVLNVLLHSTLSRMFIVSLIFFSMSVIVWFDKEGVALLINRMLWRMKGSLGIIFLVDLLLLRIELDTNTINEIKGNLEKEKIENSIINSQNNYYHPNPVANYSPQSSHSSPVSNSQEINLPNHALPTSPTSPTNPNVSMRLSNYSNSRNSIERAYRYSKDHNNNNNNNSKDFSKELRNSNEFVIGSPSSRSILNSPTSSRIPLTSTSPTRSTVLSSPMSPKANLNSLYTNDNISNINQLDEYIYNNNAITENSNEIIYPNNLKLKQTPHYHHLDNV